MQKHEVSEERMQKCNGSLLELVGFCSWHMVSTLCEDPVSLLLPRCSSQLRLACEEILEHELQHVPLFWKDLHAAHAFSNIGSDELLP